MAPQSALTSAPVLRLKASLHPFTVLELVSLDLDAISQDLTHRLQQAPQLLLGAPVVVQLPAVPVTIEKAQTLIARLRALKLIPIGLRHAQGEDNQAAQSLAQALQLPLIRDSSKDNQRESKKGAQRKPPKVVMTPVRSGQQVVNPEGDLIVFGNVGQGAEVLATGSIYIYGTLHGRALAGIRGDTSATITCQKLQSELLAIAGQFQVSEDMATSHWQQTSHICLQDGRLIIQSDS